MNISHTISNLWEDITNSVLNEIEFGSCWSSIYYWYILSIKYHLVEKKSIKMAVRTFLCLVKIKSYWFFRPTKFPFARCRMIIYKGFLGLCTFRPISSVGLFYPIINLKISSTERNYIWKCHFFPFKRNNFEILTINNIIHQLCIIIFIIYQLFF